MHNKSFFEYLGISDVERIHSQFFAWLFSNDCLAISVKQKHELMFNLFRSDNESRITKVLTEVNGIDILIVTDKEIIVIENKLKSSQHSNQLYRYKQYCDEKFPDAHKKFYFLTLTGEKTNDDNWSRMSYGDMFRELQKLELNQYHDHSVIVREYLIFLERLTTCVQDFLSKPYEYDMVFMDGKKKKIDKIDFGYKTPNERFIASNQLETILQKCFLHELSENINSKIGFVSDTRGDALIDFPIRTDILFEKRKYTTILQLQQNNIKFAFTIFGENYSKSRKEWISGAISSMEKLKSINNFSYKKLNMPKSKAYISISKKLEENYWKMDRLKLTQFINDEIKSAESMTDFLIDELVS